MKFKNLRRPTNSNKRKKLDFDEINEVTQVINNEDENMEDDLALEDIEKQYEEDVIELQLEYEKEQPKKKLLKKLLNATINKRRQWIKQDCPRIETVLEKFPMLANKRWVCNKYELNLLYYILSIIILAMARFFGNFKV
jgi:hypothetical protein